MRQEFSFLSKDGRTKVYAVRRVPEGKPIGVVQLVHGMVEYIGRYTEFADFLGMSSPNAAYKVNNLVKKGYLRKVNSEVDRREYYLEVTEKYMNYYNVSTSYVDEVMDRVEKRMSVQEWANFKHTLEVILKELV